MCQGDLSITLAHPFCVIRLFYVLMPVILPRNIFYPFVRVDIYKNNRAL